MKTIDDELINFGKYRMLTRKQLAGYDPNYLVWIAGKCKNFCSDELLEKAKYDAFIQRLKGNTMKTMIYSDLLKVFKRTCNETLDDFLEFKGDLETILSYAKTDFAIWTCIESTDEEIKVTLKQQDIWLNEEQTAWFFANILELFADENGVKMYNTEALAFAEDRMNVVIKPV